MTTEDEMMKEHFSNLEKKLETLFTKLECRLATIPVVKENHLEVVFNPHPLMPYSQANLEISQVGVDVSIFFNNELDDLEGTLTLGEAELQESFIKVLRSYLEHGTSFAYSVESIEKECEKNGNDPKDILLLVNNLREIVGLEKMS